MLNPKMFLNPHLFDKEVEQVPAHNGYGEGLLALIIIFSVVGLVFAYETATSG